MGMLSRRRQGEEPKPKRSGSSVLLIMLIVIAVHVGITAWAATTRNNIYVGNSALSTLLLAFIIMLWCPPFNILGIVGCLVMILLSAQILNR